MARKLPKGNLYFRDFFRIKVYPHGHDEFEIYIEGKDTQLHIYVPAFWLTHLAADMWTLLREWQSFIDKIKTALRG